MSTPIETTFVLTGAMAGRSITLGTQARPYPFTQGKMTMTGPPEEIALHARFLERNWQAYPEGHPKLKEVPDGQRDILTETGEDKQPAVPSDLQPNGEGSADSEPEPDNGSGAGEDTTWSAGSFPAGDGQQEELSEDAAEQVTTELNQKLLKAVQSLNAGEDENWTREGKPAMSAVERAYGASNVTRADVEAVAPGYTREQALKIQTAN